jgi:hypothetical protein
LLAFDFQGANQRGRAAQLVQGEQAERVTHQHANARRANARMPQAPQDHRKGGEAEIRLRLSAAGREEKQVHRLAVQMRGVKHPAQVHQNEGKLEGIPAWRLHLARVALVLLQFALPGGSGHRPVGDAERVENLRVRERVKASLDAVCRVPRRENQVLSGLGVARFEARCLNGRLLRVQPGSVMRHERRELGLRLGVAGHSAERLHVQFHVGDECRRNFLYFGGGNPSRLDDMTDAAGFTLGGGGDAVADGVLKHVAELQVSDLLIPFFRQPAGQ